MPVIKILEIYLPRIVAKLLASIICFIFVYIWHGLIPNILIWSILNFIGITLENLGKHTGKLEKYQILEEIILSPIGIRRLHAALSSILYLLSIVSSMYFLIDENAGNLFMDCAFNSWPFGTPLILFFLYCGAQTSIEVKNWEIRKHYISNNSNGKNGNLKKMK